MAIIFSKTAQTSDVMLFRQSMGNWWTGSCHGRSGQFPPTYVSVMRSSDQDYPAAVALRDCQPSRQTRSLFSLTV